MKLFTNAGVEEAGWVPDAGASQRYRSVAGILIAMFRVMTDGVVTIRPPEADDTARSGGNLCGDYGLHGKNCSTDDASQDAMAYVTSTTPRSQLLLPQDLDNGSSPKNQS